MLRLLTIWLDICLLRAGPQDLPASRALLGVVLVIYVGVSFLISSTSADTLTALQIALLDAVILIGFIAIMLYLMNLRPRFVQALTALAGAGSLVGLIALPVIHSISDAQQRELLSEATLFGWFFLVLWGLLITAHIFRHALNVSFFFGMAMAMLYMLISYSFMSTVFPGGAA